jgi:hypothetical protein
MSLPPGAAEILKVLVILCFIALLDVLDALVHARKVKR